MRVTIRLKLMVLTVGVIFLVGGSISYYSISLGREKIASQFAEETLNIANLLSVNVADDLYDLDVYALRLQLEHAYLGPDLLTSYVMDVEGVVLADGTAENALRDKTLSDPFGRQVLGSDDWISLKDEKTLRLGGPVSMADGTLVGYLYLVFSCDEVNHVLDANTKVNLLITVVLLFVGAFLAFFLSKSFTRPVLELAAAAKAIGEGKLDTRVKITRKDELGWLGASVNKLAVDLSRTTVSKDYFDEIISSMAEMLIVVDSALTIQTVNAATCKALGYDASVLVEKPLSLVLPGGPFHAIRGLLEKKSAWSGETSYLTKAGVAIPVSFSASSLKGSGAHLNGLVCVAQDITERKRLGEELRHSQKLEGIGQLAGGVAHEFNNLLTAIIGNLNVAMSDIENAHKLHPRLRDADQAAKRAATLTQQLLAFSRRSPFNLQAQNLGNIVEEATKLLRQTIDRRIEISLESADVLWNVLADADNIHQVIMNLCVNARDALMERLATLPASTDWKPVIIISVVNVQLDETFCQFRPGIRPGDHVHLSISDNGPGIDKSIQDKIFDPFFTTKDAGKGTGLGLASVYGIVKQHRGWINLTCTEGGGTTFGIYLARTTRAGTAEPLRKNTPSVTGGSETILFVDDEPVLRELGKTILENYGYKVILAEDGEVALKIISQDGAAEVDLIVLDLTMPKLSGWEVIRELSRICPTVKVILLSGNRISDQTNRIQDKDRVEYMMKPYRPEELAQKVREVLDQGDPALKVID